MARKPIIKSMVSTHELVKLVYRCGYCGNTFEKDGTTLTYDLTTNYDDEYGTTANISTKCTHCKMPVHLDVIA